MKTCKSCKKDKPLSEFSIRDKNKGGYNFHCKKCVVMASSNSRRKKEYGISIKEYNEMKELQHSRCLICGTHESELNYTLTVDHSHETKEIRGLLCNSCNMGLGCFKDNLVILMKAIKYLNPLIVNYKISDFINVNDTLVDLQEVPQSNHNT